MPAARRRKGSDSKKPSNSESQKEELDEKKREKLKEKDNKTPPPPKNLQGEILNYKNLKTKWSCIDSCCWFIGFICSFWWFLLFLYNAMPASFPQYVTEAITGPLPDPPGLKLHKEGLEAKHPVVFVPGIVTGGLELWEGHQCAEGLFRKRLWGGTFGEVYKR